MNFLMLNSSTIEEFTSFISKIYYAFFFLELMYCFYKLS